METAIIEALATHRNSGKPIGLITVTAIKGSTLAKPGAMMVVSENGLVAGTVGGGSFEKKVIEDSIAAIATGESRESSYDVDSDVISGLSCSARVQLFIKVFPATTRLVIVGAGHLGLELYNQAMLQGYRVTVIDERPEFASKERFPDAELLVDSDLHAALQNYSLGPKSYVTIATSSHAGDQQALAAVLESDAGYIGLIGSAQKIRTIFTNLVRRGIAREKIERVYAPMGLNVASIEPREIAVSIFSEILLVKNCGTPEHRRSVKKIDF